MTHPRNLDSLFNYCFSLTQQANREIHSGILFAKLLTQNDDSSHHGVLVPAEAYDHFPSLIISDPKDNHTREFDSFDVLSGQPKTLAYKYYQRYPERRITRLNPLFNDKGNGARLALFLRATHKDGSIGYYIDLAREAADSDFSRLITLVLGGDVVRTEGTFVLRAADSPQFIQDAALSEFLEHFDRISSMGWVNSLRAGDTGIGYTFETLVGIKENNDRQADFKGIEIKCKQTKSVRANTGKINLFQQAPVWAKREKAIDRLRRIGKLESNGLYSCYSQVTTNANNLQLVLRPNIEKNQIDLFKSIELLGHWPNVMLETRLQEKHSRAVFVKAAVKTNSLGQQFNFEEVIYCERPSIERFINLLEARQLVFEFLMSEKQNSRVRNHGYPWRLISEDVLSELFSLQVKVR